jgi:hypothetical protein
MTARTTVFPSPRPSDSLRGSSIYQLIAPMPLQIDIAMFDTYVRLPVAELAQITPWHLQSGMDEDPLEDSQSENTLSGFTEWAAGTQRVLSLGWDWTFDRESKQLTAHWNSLRTNIMVVKDGGEDLGREGTRLCIANLMTTAGWESATASALGLPWSAPH